MIIISGSILSYDFSCLASKIDSINNSDLDWIHIDIMDGVFVPNISFGFSIVKTIKKLTSKFLDVHLMIINPKKYIPILANIGINLITVHYETNFNELYQIIDLIKSYNIKVGLAINPNTPIEVLYDYIPKLDLILLMSVTPGFGGQKFITNTYKKIYDVNMYLKNHNYNTIIQVDGGVNSINYSTIVNAGAKCLVIGSDMFNSKNIIYYINNIKYNLNQK